MPIAYPARVHSMRKMFRVMFEEDSFAEKSLQSELNSAHDSYFRRNYMLALQKYKSLWWWMHANLRPELPQLDNGASFTYGIKPKASDFIELTERLKSLLEHIETDTRIPLKTPWPPGPKLDTNAFEKLGLSSRITLEKDFRVQRNGLRTQLAAPSTVAQAVSGYVDMASRALEANDAVIAAETYSELGAALAAASQRMNTPKNFTTAFRSTVTAADNYRSGLTKLMESEYGCKIPSSNKLLSTSITASIVAMRMFEEQGDDIGRGLALHNIAEALDILEPGASEKIRQTASELLPAGLQVNVGGGAQASIKSLMDTRSKHRSRKAIRPITRMLGSFELETLREDQADRDELARTYTVYRSNFQVDKFPVEKQFGSNLVDKMYTARVDETLLEKIEFHAEVTTNVVAYIPHLYFYVLPIAVGDCLTALGNYNQAIKEYAKAEIYPYLNKGIEAEYLWLKKANVYMKWGDYYFRQRDTGRALQKYQAILGADYEIPGGSELYAPSVFSSIHASAVLIAVALRNKTPMPSANPEVLNLIGKAYQQLFKINNNLNYLGLAVDWYPILRFKYLQSVARYLAEHAIQAERAYLNFLDAGQRAEFQRIQLENVLETENKAIEIERLRVQDAVQEQTIANLTHQHTLLRLQHANDAITEWDTSGRELTRMNAVLSWASHAANDQDIRVGGVQYHGQTHEFDTDVEQFYDIVGEWKEWLSWEMQRDRLVRQRDQVQSEIAISEARAQQAATRVEISELGVELAEIRRNGTLELLEHLDNQILEEDTWFRLANGMQDIANDYLYMAIEAAFYMQRAYALEMDRELDIIRFDYQHNDMNGLLAGDFLLRDVDRFTIDFLNNARKKNPIRETISISQEYPAAFAAFRETGSIAFQTTLEHFDRRYPGSHARKLRKVEVHVEGLLPSEGAHGHLEQLGVSWEWQKDNVGNWDRNSRVLGAERLFLSSYQLRRDLTVFRPSEELLDTFESSGIEAHWTLSIPRATNDIDYDAITDVKVVYYFDAHFDETLALHTANLYPNTGEAIIMLSGRFHFPDQYYSYPRTNTMAFQFHPMRFPANRESRAVAGISLRLMLLDGLSPASRNLTVKRLSDNAEVDVITDAQGEVQDTVGNPFAAWVGSSAEDTFEVSLSDGSPLTPEQVEDIQIGLRYSYQFRANV